MVADDQSIATSSSPRKPQFSPKIFRLGPDAGHRLPRRLGQEAAVISDRYQAKARADHSRGVNRTGAVDPSIEAALVRLPDEALVDFQHLRLLAVEPRHQAQREAEITWSDVDPVDARDIEDSLEIVERLLSLDHGDDQDFVICSLLILAGDAIRPSADWAAAPSTLRGVAA